MCNENLGHRWVPTRTIIDLGAILIMPGSWFCRLITRTNGHLESILALIPPRRENEVSYYFL